MISLREVVEEGDKLYVSHVGLRGREFAVINVNRYDDHRCTDFECVDECRHPWTLRHGDFDDDVLVIDDEGELDVEVKLDDIYERENNE